MDEIASSATLLAKARASCTFLASSCQKKPVENRIVVSWYYCHKTFELGFCTVVQITANQHTVSNK
jgi:hypothetical protein